MEDNEEYERFMAELRGEVYVPHVIESNEVTSIDPHIFETRDGILTLDPDTYNLFNVSDITASDILDGVAETSRNIQADPSNVIPYEINASGIDDRVFQAIDSVRVDLETRGQVNIESYANSLPNDYISGRIGVSASEMLRRANERRSEISESHFIDSEAYNLWMAAQPDFIREEVDPINGVVWQRETPSGIISESGLMFEDSSPSNDSIEELPIPNKLGSFEDFDGIVQRKVYDNFIDAYEAYSNKEELKDLSFKNLFEKISYEHRREYNTTGLNYLKGNKSFINLRYPYIQFTRQDSYYAIPLYVDLERDYINEVNELFTEYFPGYCLHYDRPNFFQATFFLGDFYIHSEMNIAPHLLRDSYGMIRFSVYDSYIMINGDFNRTTFVTKEMPSKYIHSHKSNDVGNSLCTGNSERTTLSLKYNEYATNPVNKDLLEEILYLYLELITHQSERGTPWKRYDELRPTSSSTDSYLVLKNLVKPKIDEFSYKLGQESLELIPNNVLMSLVNNYNNSLEVVEESITEQNHWMPFYYHKYMDRIKVINNESSLTLINEDNVKTLISKINEKYKLNIKNKKEKVYVDFTTENKSLFSSEITV